MLQKLRTLTLPRRRSLLVTTIVLLLSAAYCFYLATQLPRSILPGYPGDGFFPRITLAVILFFGAIVLVREYLQPDPVMTDTPEVPKPGKDPGDDDMSGPIRLDIVEAVTIAVLSIGYMFLMPRLGMEITTSIFMFLLFLPRVLHPWPKAGVISAIGAILTTGFVYLAFVIGLKVPLPLAFLPRFLGQY